MQHRPGVAGGNRPRSERAFAGSRDSTRGAFELDLRTNTVGMYALAAMRHMYEFGTTSEQLAWVKVAASQHSQYNPHAFLKKTVTVEDVVEFADGERPAAPAGLLCRDRQRWRAIVLVSPEVAQRLGRTNVKIMGQGEATRHTNNGHVDLTFTGARWSGPRAFEEAGVTPADIDYASIYDSFTITVVETLEDLGFCEKGQGGRFVQDGGLRARGGKLPVNTDGGGLCNNHPGMGGMFKILGGGAATPRRSAPRGPGAELHRIALVHGTGGSLGTRMGSSTLILGQEDA